jgi:hypothetical protein
VSVASKKPRRVEILEGLAEGDRIVTTGAGSCEKETVPGGPAAWRTRGGDVRVEARRGMMPGAGP